VGSVVICPRCGRPILYSPALGACANCIRDSDEAFQGTQELRSQLRDRFDLPGRIPETPNGLRCDFCSNHCKIGENELGFCGTKRNRGGELATVIGSRDAGALSWHHDPLPTNCVASWVCPERRGCAQPGTTNLAVFYRSCTFDCLYCQNWHFRESNQASALVSADDLCRQGLSEKTQCVCFFGGDPGSQMEHALAASEEILRARPSSPPRICWETNGNMAEDSLRRAVELSHQTGGVIKIDLKAHSDRLHRALTGASSGPTRSNFRRLVEWTSSWHHETPVVASSLLIPGYIDTEEIAGIARFIAGLSPKIPYSLLGFAPHYAMSDLPPTSIGHAERCLNAARAEGLTCVHLGNRLLLQPGDY
jgi:pyruvate formate lyase activating enzyme